MHRRTAYHLTSAGLLAIALLVTFGSFQVSAQENVGLAQCSQQQGSALRLLQQRSDELGQRSGDMDRDGLLEVAVTAVASGDEKPGRAWSLVRTLGENFEYLWTSPDLKSEIQTLHFSDVDLDGDDEVVLSTKTEILVYDGMEPVLVREVAIDSQGVHSLTTADLDGDGLLDMILCADSGSGSSLYVYSYSSAKQIFSAAGLGCTNVAVLDVDADSELEILVTDRSGPLGLEERINVLNSSDFSIEWSSDPIQHSQAVLPGKAKHQAADKGVTCTYHAVYTSEPSWCGSCGVSFPCLDRTVRLYRQDCWICTDPNLSWCNPRVHYASPCSHCSCM